MISEQFYFANAEHRMYLGIEIGGTKLQLGVGCGDGGELVELERAEVDLNRGAARILEEIQRAGCELIARRQIERIGIGFGGPVDAASGRTICSHQVDGWEDFDLAGWVGEALGRPAVIGNDCDLAALAEARFGAGRGCERVFFLTVGTGVGGGFVNGGKLDGGGRPAIAEIGHLRTGLEAVEPGATVESISSGTGIASAARVRVGGAETAEESMRDVGDLLERCKQDVESITAKIVAEAAAEGNAIAVAVLNRATRTLGWAIGQAITLLAPEVMVIGGGASLIGDELFLKPIKRAVSEYVFPPLADSYVILPAELGELVVVHGALAIAADEA